MKKEMKTISLTDFIDFVSKTGSTKQTQVSKVKNRDSYHPAKDYYKYIREGIVETHQNDGGKKQLKELIQNATDPRKIDNYKTTIDGYLKFLGRKEVTWIEPPFNHWITGDLDIKINPEIGLEINGKPTYLKLYFKADKLSKIKASQIMNLLESKLRKEVADDAVFGVLDIQRGKAFVNEEKDTTLLPLLVGEAMSFQAIWDLL
ncbi:MAG: hypothetical protein LAT51_12660 [Flavobacteriaceae bacterium]|nr:hypothetical protein [Flavobacteriaceae bacterium]